MSDNGRYIVFQSDADNLVANYNQGTRASFSSDIYLKDMNDGSIVLVSGRASDGLASLNGGSLEPSISADGRYVLFSSDSNDLVAGDTNNDQDVFLWDRQTGDTTLVSTDALGVQSNSYSDDATISRDGRYIAFKSGATNLVSHSLPDNQATGGENVFVKDLQTGIVRFVGVIPGGESDRAYVSDDGTVSFTSSRTMRRTIPTRTPTSMLRGSPAPAASPSPKISPRLSEESRSMTWIPPRAT